MIVAFPQQARVERLLSMLFGRRVPTALAPTPSRGFAVATYVTDDERVVATAQLDLGMAATAGSALTLLPPEIAARQAREGRLSDRTLENVREVLVQSTAFFNGTLRVATRLGGVHLVEGAPAEVHALERCARQRLDLRVSMPDYPEGHLRLLAA